MHAHKMKIFDIFIDVMTYKVDILTAITDIEETKHVIAALPTGSGKTIPQLILSSLVSPGYSLIDENNSSTKPKAVLVSSFHR